MNKNQTAHANEEVKTIVICENCYQKIRIPRRKRKIYVTCPTCQHKFDYQYYALGLSSMSIKPLLVGLIGSFIGFSVIELIIANQFLLTPNHFLGVVVISSIYSTCLGAVMGAAEGFLKKAQDRLYYGLKTGTIVGLVGGTVSGVIAQSVFGSILSSIWHSNHSFLWSSTVDLNLPLIRIMLVRTIGWCLYGLLVGLSYSIKEETWRDVKFGPIGGAIGGAFGGVLFDPLSSTIQGGEGSMARLIGFSILGMAIGIATFRFRKIVIHHDQTKAETRYGQQVIYMQLDQRLSANKTSLPSNSSPKLPSTSSSNPKLPPPSPRG